MSVKDYYAVIKIKGLQIKVHEGEEILLPRLKKTELNPEVLLVVKGEYVKIGKPKLKNSEVKIKIIAEELGKKLKVYKYKAKSRYRKSIGFRPLYTRVLIEKIS